MYICRIEKCVEESRNWIRLHLCIKGMLKSVSHIKPTLSVVILEKISDDVALDDINQSMRKPIPVLAMPVLVGPVLANAITLDPTTLVQLVFSQVIESGVPCHGSGALFIIITAMCVSHGTCFG